MRTVVGRLVGVAAVIGAVVAGAGVAGADTAASSVGFSPTVTLGTLMGSDTVTCGGYLAGKGSVYPGQTPGPVAVLLSSYFVGSGPQCFIQGTLTWQNLDTGATGSQPFSLSGFDGPGAPTAIYFNPGAGRVNIRVDTAHEIVAGNAQLTV
ncbi:hypothetical protein [Nocardia macrotermitis]|uniref:Secreted protein n=1 Tax=Nocardia macrotermitis TaxID=2585198 RepID=A0A7K0DBG5_9NOCA|nr:hypothetical protein [Nocardia macrotermitis]MQY22214.1 hypothetical protein [Nocardia macrotermitis]